MSEDIRPNYGFHAVLMYLSERQPHPNYAIFTSGRRDPQLGILVPPEVLMFPLSAWMALGRPEIMTVGSAPGNHIAEIRNG